MMAYDYEKLREKRERADGRPAQRPRYRTNFVDAYPALASAREYDGQVLKIRQIENLVLAQLILGNSKRWHRRGDGRQPEKERPNCRDLNKSINLKIPVLHLVDFYFSSCQTNKSSTVSRLAQKAMTANWP